MRTNNENSVLFSIGSVIELAKQKEQEKETELQRQLAEQKRIEAERVAQAKSDAEKAEQARLAAASDQARQQWEQQLAEKEANIRARIEANTERELEMLRSEYRDAEPVVVPGGRRRGFALAAIMALVVLGASAFGVHTMTADAQPADHNTATASNPWSDVTRAQRTPVTQAPDPRVAPKAPAPKVVKPATRPRIKVRPRINRPRCRWVTVTTRKLNPLRNHPLNFQGRYLITKKRVKKCRK